MNVSPKSLDIHQVPILLQVLSVTYFFEIESVVKFPMNKWLVLIAVINYRNVHLVSNDSSIDFQKITFK